MKKASLLRTSAFRFSMLYAALFAVCAALLLAIVYGVTVGLLDREIDAAIEAESLGLKQVYADLGTRGLLQAVNDRAEPGGEPGTVYALLGPDLKVLAGNLALWPSRRVAEGRFFRFEIEETTPAGTHVHAVRARAFDLPRGLRLLVGRDIAALSRFKRLMAQSLGWGLLASTGLSLLGGFLMSRIVLRRVNAIALASRSIIRGDLARRMPVRGSDDEFDLLSESLNEMLAQIEMLVTALQTMADSIAHDLREPLTRMKTRIELGLLGRGDAKGYERALREALAEADAIYATFNLLMEIARAKAGPAATEMARLDLGALALDLADLYEPLAEERGLRFRAEATTLQVLGNRQLLAQGIGNLLDNALKYTPPGGEVKLSVSTEGDQAVLIVADSGPGIPAADRERVLGPFVRLDGSRSTPGHGLGLSLAASVARLHGASLTLSDNRPGLRVTVRFPRPPGGDGWPA